MRTATSFHNLNADKGLSKIGRLKWLLLNFFNNHYLPQQYGALRIEKFCPEINDVDWEKIPAKASPSRSLSDLFWLNVDWESVKGELGNINIFDTGTGSGGYALKINEFAKGISKYSGVDYHAKSGWTDLMRAYPFIKLYQHSSNEILNVIPADTNLFMSQSAIEHFDDDLLYFHQIKKFIDITQNNTIQIHLFPSAACLKLNLWHGVRQYTPRTVSKIATLFDSPSSYSVLFQLGGKHCNNLHFRYITLGLLLSNVDYRDKKALEYSELVKAAIDKDLSCDSGGPNFYALVVHSNFKQPIFKSMKSLTRRCS